jgi:hypothetical protein
MVAREKQYNSTSDSTIDEALEAGMPPFKCYVYKLKVGGNSYIGFTSQSPKKRLAQHVENSKNGSQLKLHKELRRFGYLNEFQVLGEYENEILGLVAEISFINEYSPQLNSSPGGEGNHYEIIEFGNILYVRNKALFHRSTQKAERVERTVNKLFDRYEAIEKYENKSVIKFIRLKIPVSTKTLYMKSREHALNLHKLLVERRKLLNLIKEDLSPEFNAFIDETNRIIEKNDFFKRTGLQLIGCKPPYKSIMDALYKDIRLDRIEERRVTRKIKDALVSLPANVPIYVARTPPEEKKNILFPHYKYVLGGEGIKRACIFVNIVGWSAGKYFLWGGLTHSGYRHTIETIRIW